MGDATIVITIIWKACWKAIREELLRIRRQILTKLDSIEDLLSKRRQYLAKLESVEADTSSNPIKRYAARSLIKLLQGRWDRRSFIGYASFTITALTITIPLCIVTYVLLVIFTSCFALATLLLVLVSLVVVRLLQLVRSGESFETLSLYKLLIRFWIILLSLSSLVGLGFFFPLAKYVSPIKQLTLLQLPLTNWVGLISILCSLGTLSSVLYVGVTQIFELYITMHGSGLNVGQAFSEIIDGLLFWWASNILIKHVPSFNEHEILGLPTQIWIQVSVLILITYNLIIMFTHIIVSRGRRFITGYLASTKDESGWLSLLKKHFHLKYVIYIANGMITSTSFVICSLLLLLTWILYFGSRLDLKSSANKRIWEYGTWTFASMLICSFLWVIKTVVLLIWEAHTVYYRLEDKILSTSQHLYFLGITGSTTHNFLKLFVQNSLKGFIRTHPGLHLLTHHANPEIAKNNLNKFKKLCPLFGMFSVFNLLPKVRQRVRNDLLIQNGMDPTMDELQRATQYFLAAKHDLLEDTYISDILENFHPSGEKWKKLILGADHEIINPRGPHVEQVDENSSTQASNGIDGVKVIIENEIQKTQQERPVAEENSTRDTNTTEGKWKKDLTLFRKNIKQQNSFLKNIKHNSNQEITFSDFQTWVERAHNECLNLANTLSSAKEVGDCLNQIISVVLIGLIFIMWLLVTGLATTKVLVLIASPLLAASFIFGETCKIFFQGIIYVFVVHPFDVGDLCVIDGIMLEVRSIGVWTATFTKVDKFGTAKEFVMHSNTQLMTKTIINHKTKFDWSDRVDFNLGQLNKINCYEKKRKILNFFMDYLEPEEEEQVGGEVKEREAGGGVGEGTEGIEGEGAAVGGGGAAAVGGGGAAATEEGAAVGGGGATATEEGAAVGGEGGTAEGAIVQGGEAAVEGGGTAEGAIVQGEGEAAAAEGAGLEEEESRLKHNEDGNGFEKKKCPLLSRMPNLIVSATEDNSITIVIHLEYKAQDTKEWTYYECLRRKDDMRGEFHLYMQDVISEFKRGRSME